MSITTSPSTSLASTAELAETLRARIAGVVTVPGDAAYDQARTAWNLAVDQQPAAVVNAASVGDVVATVAVARRAGLRVSPQATGHAAGLLGDLGDAVLLRTHELRGVAIDPSTRSVRAEAGAQWQDVVGPAAEHGLAVPHGSAPDVGVVGYTLGGGMGWYARKLGLAANHVTAIELVTASAEQVRVDAQHEPELFWALRGGGGSVGIVTAIEFAAHPITEVQCGWLIWPWERAAEVLPAWHRWTQVLPDTVTSVGRLLQMPPFPEIPEPLRGRRLVVVEVAMLEDAATAARMLAELRALEPEIDTIATAPVTALPELHQDPPAAVPFAADHAVLERLPGDAIAALLDVAGPASGSQLLSVEVRHCGGALGTPVAGGGARSHIAGEYVVHAVGITPTPADVELIAAQAGRVMTALAPWRSSVGYANFSEQPGEKVLDEDASARLLAVKQGVDPTGLIRVNGAPQVRR